jgi:hypothetical protein
VSIAPFTAGVTLLALINPRLGRFNVTDKGTMIDRARFDFSTARVTLALLALSVAGLALAFPLRLLLFSLSAADPSDLDAIVMNSLWALGNLITLVAATCVAYEQPQQRTAPRIKRDLPCELFVSGETLPGRTWDLSESGIRVVLTQPMPVPAECRIAIAAAPGPRCEVRARRVRCGWNESGQVEAAFAFESVDAATHRALVELIFSDPRAWSAESYPPDRLARSFWYLLTTVWRVMRPRVARTGQSPRLDGTWRAWYGGVECRCLWLTGDGALIELPIGTRPVAEPSRVRVEIQSNRFVEAPAALAGAEGDSRIVLEFQWPDFAAMREWWTSVYRDDPAARPSGRRGLARRLLADL